ncbi:response regulator [bacterium]|nr:response regulator [bacterium]
MDINTLKEHKFQTEIEHNMIKHVVTIIISGLTFILNIFLGYDALVKGHLTLFYVDIFVGTLLLINFILGILKPKYIFQRHFLAYVLMLFMSFLIINGGVSGTGLLWIVLFPIISFFLLGVNWGSYLSVLFLIFSLVITILSLKYPEIFYQFNFDYLKRVYSIYCIIFITMFAYEYNHKKNYILLQNEFKKNLKIMKSKEQSDARNRAKSEFLANMSHEIRTPLNVIQGFTSLLYEKTTDRIYKKYLSYISSNASLLLDLINDILDISKVEAGKLQITKGIISTTQVFGYVKSLFSDRFVEKGIDYIWNIEENFPEYIVFDELRFKQILSNLIGNAFKFTEKGYVKISISSQKIGEKHINLFANIEDTGVGIPSNQINKIFGAFEQKEGQDAKKYGGTGLGLTITKQLITLLNGEISLKSEEGIGSTFSITFFDIELSQEKIETESNILDFDFEKATIMIVEDYELSRVLIREYFSGTNISVIEAENGLDAIEKLKKNSIDLILMDLRMPIMDGYEATKQIKVDINSYKIPIIALTASAIGKDFIKLKKIGFSSFLLKPLSKTLLFSEIAEYIPCKKEITSKTKVNNIFAKPDAITELEKERILKLFNTNRSFQTEILDNFCVVLSLAIKNHFIEDIEKTATLLKTIGENYKLELFIEKSKTLLSYCEEFDIEAINSFLNDIYRFFKEIQS